MKTPSQIPTHLSTSRLLGLGCAGLDLIAVVPTFPTPDSKLRTLSSTLQGGGNVANSLTAARRLGLPTTLLTLLGDDPLADAALQELSADGVDVSRVTKRKGISTMLTYVMVDLEGGTRTCISTPCGGELSLKEVEDVEKLVKEANLVVLDGRHTKAAIELAKIARGLGVKILVDVERERDNIRELLALADFVVTNETYPDVFAGRKGVAGMLKLLEWGEIQVVISTRGAQGSVMVTKERERKKGKGKGVEIRRAVESGIEVMHCSACKVHQVLDTTGAGDAYIAAVCYGIVTNMTWEDTMALAAQVGAKSVQGLGARGGMPMRDDVLQWIDVQTDSMQSVSKHA